MGWGHKGEVSEASIKRHTEEHGKTHRRRTDRCSQTTALQKEAAFLGMEGNRWVKVRVSLAFYTVQHGRSIQDKGTSRLGWQ